MEAVTEQQRARVTVTFERERGGALSLVGYLREKLAAVRKDPPGTRRSAQLKFFASEVVDMHYDPQVSPVQSYEARIATEFLGWLEDRGWLLRETKSAMAYTLGGHGDDLTPMEKLIRLWATERHENTRPPSGESDGTEPARTAD
jgi:hypothetical protein